MTKKRERAAQRPVADFVQYLVGDWPPERQVALYEALSASDRGGLKPFFPHPRHQMAVRDLADAAKKNLDGSDK